MAAGAARAGAGAAAAVSDAATSPGGDDEGETDDAGATESGEGSGAAATSVQLALIAAVGSTLSLRVGAGSSALSLNSVDPPSWPLPLSSCDDAQTAHGTYEQARQCTAGIMERMAHCDASGRAYECANAPSFSSYSCACSSCSCSRSRKKNLLVRFSPPNAPWNAPIHEYSTVLGSYSCTVRLRCLPPARTCANKPPTPGRCGARLQAG